MKTTETPKQMNSSFYCIGYDKNRLDRIVDLITSTNHNLFGNKYSVPTNTRIYWYKIVDNSLYFGPYVPLKREMDNVHVFGGMHLSNKTFSNFIWDWLLSDMRNNYTIVPSSDLSEDCISELDTKQKYEVSGNHTDYIFKITKLNNDE